MNICYNMNKPEDIMLSERSQTQEIIYCINLFIWNIQNIRKYIEIESRLVGCQGLGSGNGTWFLIGSVYFGHDENWHNNIVKLILNILKVIDQISELYGTWMISQ